MKIQNIILSPMFYVYYMRCSSLEAGMQGHPRPSWQHARRCPHHLGSIQSWDCRVSLTDTAIPSQTLAGVWCTTSSSQPPEATSPAHFTRHHNKLTPTQWDAFMVCSINRSVCRVCLATDPDAAHADIYLVLPPPHCIPLIANLIPLSTSLCIPQI